MFLQLNSSEKRISASSWPLVHFTFEVNCYKCRKGVCVKVGYMCSKTYFYCTTLCRSISLTKFDVSYQCVHGLGDRNTALTERETLTFLRLPPFSCQEKQKKMIKMLFPAWTPSWQSTRVRITLRLSRSWKWPKRRRKSSTPGCTAQRRSTPGQGIASALSLLFQRDTAGKYHFTVFLLRLNFLRPVTARRFLVRSCFFPFCHTRTALTQLLRICLF